jgi:glycosyltransferase involved in cell wall biosynthesis
LNIWILNHYASTTDIAGGARHFELARELIKRGHNLTILASSFRHNVYKETRLKPGETWKIEEVEEVKFIWVRTFPYQNNSWRRAVNMLSFMVRAYTFGRRFPLWDDRIPVPDVVIGSSVHLFAVLSAYYLSRHFDAHFLMEVRDLWPQTLVDMGKLSEQNLLTKSLRFLERFLYLRAEEIIVLLPKAGEYIQDLGIDADKICWVPNGVNLSRFSKERQHGESDHFTVMYAGSHGRANGLRMVLDAAQVIQDQDHSDVRFVLVGDGPEKPRLRHYCNELELMNVSFRAPVAKREVPSLLAQADTLVFPLKEIDVFKYGISSNKLFDYLASRKPVLFACNAANNIVEEAKCGLAVSPGDPEALANAVIRLYHMSSGERREMGERGYSYVKRHHDYSMLARKLERVLEGLESEAD